MMSGSLFNFWVPDIGLANSGMTVFATRSTIVIPEFA